MHSNIVRGSLHVVEGSNGYYLYGKDPQGQDIMLASMGDGVDAVTLRETGESVTPGTPLWDEAIQEMVQDEDQLAEALGFSFEGDTPRTRIITLDVSATPEPGDYVSAIFVHLAGGTLTPDPNHPPTSECPESECWMCGMRDCPHNEPLHYHHDGCPACSQDDVRKHQPVRFAAALTFPPYLLDQHLPIIDHEQRMNLIRSGWSLVNHKYVRQWDEQVMVVPSDQLHYSLDMETQYAYGEECAVISLWRWPGGPMRYYPEV